jgi:flagellar basal body-associated protein FliL
MNENTANNPTKSIKVLLTILLLIVIIPVCVYHFLTLHTVKLYVIIGLISIFANVFIYHIWCLKHRQELNKEGYDLLSISVMSLSLTIPFATFYVLLSILFAGFKIPPINY